jgi:NADP-dependent 3-hydroxy acid dehydrogenase YdfG
MGGAAEALAAAHAAAEQLAIAASAVARAIGFAIAQPAVLDINGRTRFVGCHDRRCCTRTQSMDQE